MIEWNFINTYYFAASVSCLFLIGFWFFFVKGGKTING